VSDAPACGYRADFKLREILFDFAHRVRKIVRIKAGPIAQRGGGKAS
jgi:hypothetical protein